MRGSLLAWTGHYAYQLTGNENMVQGMPKRSSITSAFQVIEPNLETSQVTTERSQIKALNLGLAEI